MKGPAALLIAALAVTQCAADGPAAPDRARIRVEHFSPEFAVCTVHVPGEGDSLAALNVTGKKLLWKQKSGRTNYCYWDMRTRTLFTVEDADVVCRDTAGGTVRWRANLPRKDVRVSRDAKDIIELRDGPKRPSLFVPELWLTGAKVLVPRDQVYWGKSIHTLAGSETFLLDRSTGAVSYHRARGLADALRESFRTDRIVPVAGVGEFDKNLLLRIIEKKLWPRVMTGYRVNPLPAMIHPYRRRPVSAASWDGSAVIISVKDRTEKEIVSKRPRYDQTRWAFLPGYLIHYARAERPALRERHKKSAGGGRKLVYIEPFRRWMDIYDASGALLKQKENVMFISRKGPLDYLGTTPNGKAIFKDDENVHLLEVPTLSHVKRIALTDINPNPGAHDVMGGATGSDIIFCMTGGAPGVIFYDTAAGKTVWTYRQNVETGTKDLKR